MDPIQIRLPKRVSLGDIEGLLLDLESRGDYSSIVWMPREFAPTFFLESRVTALLAATAQAGSLQVRDWIQKNAWNREQALRRFTGSIEGIASLKYSRQMSNAGEHIDLGLSDCVSHLLETGGVIEDHPTTPLSPGTPQTFCALDGEAPEPVRLAGLLGGRDRFINRFLSERRDFLQRAYGDKKAQELSLGRDRELGSFVYELFQNAHEHGRLDGTGIAIAGLRFLRLRKHIHYDFGGLIQRAASFDELKQYLCALKGRNTRPELYEVSVSDHGLGITRRLVASRPDLGLSDDSLSVNDVIAQALSSKRDRPGAGHGLGRALDAVSRLHGFISIRTGRIWLYRDLALSDRSREHRHLLPVGSPVLAEIPGTHVNLLFPLR